MWCRVRINTLSKARYGTLLKQLGGWGWVQDVLQVGGQRAAAGSGADLARMRLASGVCKQEERQGQLQHVLQHEVWVDYKAMV